MHLPFSVPSQTYFQDVTSAEKARVININNILMESEPEENPAVFEKLCAKLTEKGVEYTVTEHEPCKTSEESAKVRGVSLASGAKAMLCEDFSKKLEKDYWLVVLSAAKKIDWKKLRVIIGTKKFQLVKLESVFGITGCINGAVPPFGSLMGLHTICDKSLIDQGDSINFNAGLRTRSISMKTEDYIKFENP